MFVLGWRKNHEMPNLSVALAKRNRLGAGWPTFAPRRYILSARLWVFFCFTQPVCLACYRVKVRPPKPPVAPITDSRLALPTRRVKAPLPPFLPLGTSAQSSRMLADVVSAVIVRSPSGGEIVDVVACTKPLGANARQSRRQRGAGEPGGPKPWVGDSDNRPSIGTYHKIYEPRQLIPTFGHIPKRPAEAIAAERSPVNIGKPAGRILAKPEDPGPYLPNVVKPPVAPRIKSRKGAGHNVGRRRLSGRHFVNGNRFFFATDQKSQRRCQKHRKLPS